MTQLVFHNDIWRIIFEFSQHYEMTKLVQTHSTIYSLVKFHFPSYFLVGRNSLDEALVSYTNNSCYPNEQACLALIQYVVSKGADSHCWDNVVLRMASQDGHLQIVQFCMSLEGNEDECDTVLDGASRYGHVHLVRWVFEREKQNKTISDEHASYCVLQASRKGYLSVVQHFMEHWSIIMHAAIGTERCNDYSADAALLEAQEHGFADIVQYLKLKGAQ